jgi:hypothetical protein
MKKRRFNGIDIGIIVVLVLVIAAGVFFFLRYNRADQLAGKQVTIRFQVEVPDLSQEVAEGFPIGAPVIFGTTNTDEGAIVDVEVAPYMRTMQNKEDGAYTWEQYGDKYQATVTIEAEVTETDEAFIGESTEIQVGANMPFHGKGFAAADGFVVGIDKVE